MIKKSIKENMTLDFFPHTFPQHSLFFYLIPSEYENLLNFSIDMYVTLSLSCQYPFFLNILNS